MFVVFIQRAYLAALYTHNYTVPHVIIFLPLIVPIVSKAHFVRHKIYVFYIHAVSAAVAAAR